MKVLKPCPKCKGATKLKAEATTLKPNGQIVVTVHRYCINEDCDFEELFENCPKCGSDIYGKYVLGEDKTTSDMQVAKVRLNCQSCSWKYTENLLAMPIGNGRKRKIRAQMKRRGEL